MIHLKNIENKIDQYSHIYLKNNIIAVCNSERRRRILEKIF